MCCCLLAPPFYLFLSYCDVKPPTQTPVNIYRYPYFFSAKAASGQWLWDKGQEQRKCNWQQALWGTLLTMRVLGMAATEGPVSWFLYQNGDRAHLNRTEPLFLIPGNLHRKSDTEHLVSLNGFSPAFKYCSRRNLYLVKTICMVIMRSREKCFL